MSSLALAKNGVFHIEKQVHPYGPIRYWFALRMDRPESPDRSIGDFIGQAPSAPSRELLDLSAATAMESSFSSATLAVLPRLPTHPPRLQPGARSPTPPRRSRPRESAAPLVDAPMMLGTRKTRPHRISVHLFESSLSSADTQSQTQTALAEQSAGGSRARRVLLHEDRVQELGAGDNEENRRKSSKRRRLLSPAMMQEAEDRLDHSSQSPEQSEQQLPNSATHACVSPQ